MIMQDLLKWALPLFFRMIEMFFIFSEEFKNSDCMFQINVEKRVRTSSLGALNMRDALVIVDVSATSSTPMSNWMLFCWMREGLLWSMLSHAFSTACESHISFWEYIINLLFYHECIGLFTPCLSQCRSEILYPSIHLNKTKTEKKKNRMQDKQ